MLGLFSFKFSKCITMNFLYMLLKNCCTQVPKYFCISVTWFCFIFLFCCRIDYVTERDMWESKLLCIWTQSSVPTSAIQILWRSRISEPSKYNGKIWYFIWRSSVHVFCQNIVCRFSPVLLEFKLLNISKMYLLYFWRYLILWFCNRIS